MKRIVLTLLVLILPVMAFLVMAEAALRFSPSLISLALLERYPNQLRSRIAISLGLPNKSEHRAILSAERHDKGMDIYLPVANASYLTPSEPEDKLAGAIESFTVDADGYCNPTAKSAMTSQQVIVLGGSVPSCAGVEAQSVFTTQLGEISGLKTYDMTVGGVGPFEYVEVFRRDGLAKKPQAVVLAFSEANDLRDCQRHVDHIAGRSRPSRSAREWGFPFTSSYALSFVKAGVELLVKQTKAGVAEDFGYTIDLNGAVQPMNIRNGDLDELDAARAVHAGAVSPAICEPALADFVALAKANGFVPIVMATPASYGVYEEAARFGKPEFGSLMSAYGKSQRDWLAQNAVRIGYVFIDPVPSLQAKAESSPLFYFPSNAHLTIAGHRALAEAAAPLVMKALSGNP